MLSLWQVFPKLTSMRINPPKRRGGEAAWGTLGFCCRGVNAHGVAALGQLNNLRSLEMHYVTDLTGEQFSALADGQRQLPLGSLVVEGGQAMTEVSARALSQVTKYLTYLMLTSDIIASFLSARNSIGILF